MSATPALNATILALALLATADTWPERKEIVVQQRHLLLGATR